MNSCEEKKCVFWDGEKCIDEVEVIKEEENKWMNKSCDNCWFFKDNDCKKMSIQSFSGSVQLGKGFYCSCWSSN